MTRWIVVVLVALAGGTGAAAPAEIPLRLSDAIARAIAANPLLATSTLALDEADAAQLVERAAHDPRLEAQTSGHAERDQPRVTPFTQALARDVLGASASVVKPLEDGGDVRFTVGAQREVATSRLVDPTAGTFYDYEERTLTPRIEASVREPLLGGRAIGPAARARLAGERDAASLDREATAQRVIRDVEHAYWQLYLAQQEVAIRRDATAAAESQLRQVEAEIARGGRPRLAAAEIDDELARRREDELIAGGAVGERSLELARLLGVAPTGELRASDPLPAALADTGLARASDPPQLAAASARVAAASAHVAEVHDSTRWQLDATLTASLASARDRWRTAIDDTAGYSGWTVELGLTLRAPLTDRAAVGRDVGARARWLEARVARADAAAELAEETQRWTNRRDVANQRRVALERARSLAEENLAAERNRWDRGDTTSYEVLRRQAAVSDVRLRFERARVDELDADVALSALRGELHSGNE